MSAVDKVSTAQEVRLRAAKSSRRHHKQQEKARLVYRAKDKPTEAVQASTVCDSPQSAHSKTPPTTPDSSDGGREPGPAVVNGVGADDATTATATAKKKTGGRRHKQPKPIAVTLRLSGTPRPKDREQEDVTPAQHSHLAESDAHVSESDANPSATAAAWGGITDAVGSFISGTFGGLFAHKGQDDHTDMATNQGADAQPHHQQGQQEPGMQKSSSGVRERERGRGGWLQLR
mmetsp:Transcript_21677/g.61682  ORF Transcript_21677/g.61682 Transcript_21677/m.61682 type:complete len:232 (-) Transcript_21677:154-849(-)